MGMGSGYYFYRFGCKYLKLFLFVFLVSASNQPRFLAEGRAIRKLVDAAKMGDGLDGGEKILLRARIGSRPPRCEMRCGSCGHCEAIQVPAVPQDRNRRKHIEVSPSFKGEDISNYKPMNWKCKCGDMIINP